MKRRLARFAPEFVKRAIQVRRETTALRALPGAPPCPVEALFPASELDLAGIVTSMDAGNAWNGLDEGIRTFDVPDGRGGVNPGDRRALYYLIHHFRPDSVLEIGTHIGASTTSTAAALRDMAVARGNGKPPRLVSVDKSDVNDPVSRPWSKWGARCSPREMILRMECGHFVHFVTSPSLDYLSRFDGTCDFIFLDGDHGAATVYREVPAALRILAPKGVILLHDYFPGLKPLWSNGHVIPGPYLATERLLAEGLRVTIIPLGELPWPTKLGSSVSSLALLVRRD